MNRSTTTLALALLAVAGCAHADDQKAPTVDDIVGCYEVEVGEWEPAMSAAEIDIYRIASTIQLTHEVGWNGQPKIQPAPGITPPELYTGIAWYKINPEQIELHWATGLDVGLRLLVKGDTGTLSGTVEAAYEDRPPQYTAPVTLRRVECE